MLSVLPHFLCALPLPVCPATSCVPCLTSCVLYLTSCVPCHFLCALPHFLCTYLTSCVPCLTSCVPYLTSCVPCLTSCVPTSLPVYLPHFMCALPHFLCTYLTSCVPCQVTEFLYQCAEATGTLRTPLTTSGEVGGANSSGGGARKPPQPITLFSSGHTRAEVAVQLMLSSQDIVEGFDIAQGIMQVHVHACTCEYTQCSAYEMCIDRHV